MFELVIVLQLVVVVDNYYVVYYNFYVDILVVDYIEHIVLVELVVVIDMLIIVVFVIDTLNNIVDNIIDMLFQIINILNPKLGHLSLYQYDTYQIILFFIKLSYKNHLDMFSNLVI